MNQRLRKDSLHPVESALNPAVQLLIKHKELSVDHPTSAIGPTRFKVIAALSLRQMTMSFAISSSNTHYLTILLIPSIPPHDQ